MLNGQLNINGYSIIVHCDQLDTKNGFDGGLIIYAKEKLICTLINIEALMDFNQSCGSSGVRRTTN